MIDAHEPVRKSKSYARIVEMITADVQSPLEHAAQSAQMAIADFYVLIGRANSHEELAPIQTILSDLWVLMDGCERAARRKSETL